MYIWDKVLKNDCIEVIRSAKFFKGCLPQILLGPFLNTLTHFYYVPNKYKFFEDQDPPMMNDGIKSKIQQKNLLSNMLRTVKLDMITKTFNLQ